MIQPCNDDDIPNIHDIINEAAAAYKGVIPPDCWHEPYMKLFELMDEIRDGVQFWGLKEADRLIGVMGLQSVLDVTLIRHAYVRRSHQNKGIGSVLLADLARMATTPLLVGTWADAHWAIRFYQRHGFRLVSPEEKDRLLTTYWNIPDRQRQASVVLEKPGDSRPTPSASATRLM